MTYGVVAILAAHYAQSARWFLRQPYPSRTEERHGCLFHHFAEIFERAEVEPDGIGDVACRDVLFGRVGGELLEVEDMVQHLSGVVE